MDVPVAELGMEVPKAAPAVDVPKAEPRVEIPVAKPGMEVLVAKPGVEIPIAKPGVEIPVAKPGVEIPVAKPGVEIPVAKPGMEVLVAKPGVEIPVAKPDVKIPVAKLGVEIPVAKPSVGVLIAKPGVEVPVVNPGVKSWSAVGCTPKKDIDPEIEGTDESVGYPVARFPLGDIDFRRIGTVLGDDPKETGDNAGEFPIERWGGERWNSHSELKPKIAAHGAGPRRSSEKDSERSPNGLQEVRPRELSPQDQQVMRSFPTAQVDDSQGMDEGDLPPTSSGNNPSGTPATTDLGAPPPQLPSTSGIAASSRVAVQKPGNDHGPSSTPTVTRSGRVMGGAP
ncbi:hypothetical protein GE061_008663 [Apolygus lucorum]|uniref:Uncharacterized protein n=1 Tax=Apolygus lucorum TaxID=248454 RepID=A0A8S9WLH1_APOLU|nr:hypothetical protein GE061_008663 [Apolygus lucorum]